MARSKKSAAPATPAAEPVAQQPEVVEASVNDSDPAQASASAFGKQESSGRIRGPVEEVIAKRVRTLGKKIQRFRAYAAQPSEKLNADQKSAIASLPILEAQSRELEDLIKSGGPVEVAELGEAAKFRGLKEDIEAKAKSDSEAASGTYQISLATPLSRFLNLYTLLHPARSADHEHLTFSPLDLPSQLQDEVQATDVLRVGRMWEDLLAGGEKAGEVLGGLAKGSTGEDAENDHVHHLLNLLSQSSTDASDPNPAQDDSPETQAESPPAPEADSREVIEAEPSSTIEASTATLPNGHAEHSAPAKKGGATLNFLQDDELDSRQGEEVPEQEEGFEIVEPAAAHETEHYDVPATSTPAPEAAAPALLEETTKPTFDWADEHDEPSPAAEFAAPEASAPAAAPAPTDPSADKPAEAESSTTPTSATFSDRGRGGRGGRGRGSGPRRGGNRSNGGASTSQGEAGQAALPIPPKPQTGRQASSKAGVVVDEDGFEMKVKPGPKRGGGAGGRGGRGGVPREGGEFRGGGRGRGNGEGRGGRGGSQRNGASGEGQGGQRPPRPQGQGQRPAPTAAAEAQQG